MKTEANSLFDKLDPEEGQEEKEFQVEGTDIEQMIEGFEEGFHQTMMSGKFPEFAEKGFLEYLEHLYTNYKEFIPDKYEAKDITAFSVWLITHEGHAAMLTEYRGIFLSALINHCQEERITIATGNKAIAGIGYRLRDRKLKVVGEVDYFCTEMESGEALLDGGVRHSVAENMKGGTVRIGHVAKEAGKGMEGGELFISEPSSFLKVGQNMTGGIIQVNTDYDPEYVHDDFHGGKIYFKGKKIEK